jgi:hypothetical protein
MWPISLDTSNLSVEVAMTASYFRDLAARCRTASRDSFDLFAKEEFRQLATEFNSKADELNFSSKHPRLVAWRWGS